MSDLNHNVHHGCKHSQGASELSCLHSPGYYTASWVFSTCCDSAVEYTAVSTACSTRNMAILGDADASLVPGAGACPLKCGSILHRSVLTENFSNGFRF